VGGVPIQRDPLSLMAHRRGWIGVADGLMRASERGARLTCNTVGYLFSSTDRMTVGSRLGRRRTGECVNGRTCRPLRDVDVDRSHAAGTVHIDGAACSPAATECSRLGNAVVRYGVVVAYRLTRSADSGRRRKGRGRVQITQFWTLSQVVGRPASTTTRPGSE
jgi:hypothetical protein